LHYQVTEKGARKRAFLLLRAPYSRITRLKFRASHLLHLPVSAFEWLL
jgi:hypothetical protein